MDAAVASMDEHPRDNAALRLVLHDHVCRSDYCVGTPGGFDHARRTQTQPARVLMAWYRANTVR